MANSSGFRTLEENLVSYLDRRDFGDVRLHRPRKLIRGSPIVPTVLQLTGHLLRYTQADQLYRTPCHSSWTDKCCRHIYRALDGLLAYTVTLTRRHLSTTVSRRFEDNPKLFHRPPRRRYILIYPVHGNNSRSAPNNRRRTSAAHERKIIHLGNTDQQRAERLSRIPSSVKRVAPETIRRGFYRSGSLPQRPGLCGQHRRTTERHDK